MRPLLLAGLALLTLASCGEATSRTYDNGTLSLLVVHTAKDACTCRFVMNQTAAYCANWTRASPDIAGFTVDEAKKTVSASVLVGWTAKAHFVSDRFGCELDD
jgi:hypothetical protein